ncbi:MAG: hypothetical protein EOO77_27955 [Oxalobacteraceae bacterium]|nr:MAG: hypothetical protein EOO77_27955 [Oxalobacteraceae bacterium]
MKALLSAFFAFFILAFHVPANAVFYRAVGKKPDVVFNNGFKPWGSNRNLFDHTNGESCNRNRVVPGAEDVEGSTYVSLSATLAGALEVARGRMTPPRPAIPDPTLRIWIYEVRPTDTVYNAVLTFERADVDLLAGPMRIPYLNARVLAEWEDTGPIPPERIRAARQYQLIDREVVEVPGTYVANPRYIDLPDAPNPDPLPATVLRAAPTFMARARTVINAIALGLISACWCDRASVGPAKRSVDGSSENSDDPSGDACVSRVMYLNDVVPRVRYFPVKGWRVGL